MSSVQEWCTKAADLLLFNPTLVHNCTLGQAVSTLLATISFDRRKNTFERFKGEDPDYSLQVNAPWEIRNKKCLESYHIHVAE